MPLHERRELRALLRPVDDHRQVRAREHEVLGDGHVRDEREVLVDHPDAEGLRVARVEAILTRAPSMRMRPASAGW